MPIKSYLVHPIEGERDKLIETLSSIDECEVTSAENKDLLILVTETFDENQESMLKQKLDALTNIKVITLVSGFNTPIKS